MNRKEIKEKAKELAFKNKWNIWKPLLLVGLISGVVSTIISMMFGNSSFGSLLSLAWSIATVPASIGFVYYMLQLVRGSQLDVKEALLSKYNIFGVILITLILVGLFTTLWSLLLIVPGIIYAFKMSMVQYLIADKAEKETKAKAIMNTSQRMMDGYKMDYLVFNLSFIGWYLLGSITCGIAYIWIVPYVTTANVMYYEELKKVKNIDKIEE